MNKNPKANKRIIKLIIILIGQLSFGQSEIIGFVKSSITGLRPITDAYTEITNIKKSILESMQRVDRLGFFKFQNLEPNKIYTLKVSAFGYANNWSKKVRTKVVYLN